MSRQRPKPCPRVCLVEGKSEQFVIPHWLEKAGVAWPSKNEPVWLEDCAGYERLITSIAIEMKASGVTALGVIVDADTSAANRWTGMATRLHQLGVSGVPQALPPEGFIGQRDAMQVGVWVMPDNINAGMLESVLLQARDSDATLLSHAEESVKRARALGATTKEVHHAKAELHTWLAWQDPPDLQMHTAIDAGVLKPPSADQPFVQWFRKLFSL